MDYVKTIQIIFSFDRQKNMLNNAIDCDRLLDSFVEEMGLTKIKSMHHVFNPQGISVVQILSESHIALHTWPEHNRGYITATTCNMKTFDEQTIKNILTKNGLTLLQVGSIQ